MGRPPFILDLSSPTTETMKIARDELRETPENVARGLKELQELLENDKTIKYDTDEEFLMCFLRPCKFYARSAYELVSNLPGNHKMCCSKNYLQLNSNRKFYLLR